MKVTISGIILTLFTTGMLSFYGSAFFKPELFRSLFKPVTRTIMAATFGVLVFLVGAMILGANAKAALPLEAKDSPFYTAIDGATNALATDCLWLYGLLMLLFVIAQVILIAIDKMAKEERKEKASKD